MAFFLKNRPFNSPESAVTPQDVYLNRRQILRATAVSGAAALIAGGIPAAALAQSAQGDPTADLYPAASNPLYNSVQGNRALTNRQDALTYNNFYEYGTNKNIWQAAQSLPRRPWTIEVDGLVAKPQIFDIDTLIRAMPLEERIYRHRCVETWSMVAPWSGFSLRHLLNTVEPLGSAKYVAFETAELWNKGSVLSAQFPWPYREGLRLDEAMNDLTLMATGIYGEPMPSQNGAPIRLVVPWKYGFKGIKSIVRITLTDTPPPTFWSQANGNEYGFWANVNPEVPHRRWSQAQEWDISLGRSTTFPTLPWNGYGEFVADMYGDLDPVKDRIFT